MSLAFFFVELPAAYRTPYRFSLPFFVFELNSPPPPGRAKVAQTPGRARVIIEHAPQFWISEPTHRHERTDWRLGMEEGHEKAWTANQNQRDRLPRKDGTGANDCDCGAAHPPPPHPQKKRLWYLPYPSRRWRGRRRLCTSSGSGRVRARINVIAVISVLKCVVCVDWPISVCRGLNEWPSRPTAGGATGVGAPSVGLLVCQLPTVHAVCTIYCLCWFVKYIYLSRKKIPHTSMGLFRASVGPLRLAGALSDPSGVLPSQCGPS